MSAKIACEVLHTLSLGSQLKVSSLLLLAPAPPTPLVLPDELRQQQLTAYSTFESAKWTVANILMHKPLPDTMVDDLAHDATNMSEGAKRGWIELGMAHDCTPTLERMQDLVKSSPDSMPKVVVLVGREDKVETVEKVQSAVVEPCTAAGWDVSMRVIEGVGHLLPVEAPDEVVVAVTELLDVA